MRLQPQIGYLALLHAQHYGFSNGGKIGFGNPNYIYTRTSQVFYDFTSRSYIKH